MPVDLTAIRALLASVAGFTPGPWDRSPDGLVWAGDRAFDPLCHVVDLHDARLIAAAPDLHRELTEAVGEIERLRAHNARMVALLSKIADAMDAADREPTWSDRMIVVTDSLPDATDLRRLAAGEVDDG